MEQESESVETNPHERTIHRIHKRVTPVALWATYIVGLMLCLFMGYKFFEGIGSAKEINGREAWLLGLFLVFVFGIGLMNLALVIQRLRRLERAQEWLINTTHWTIGRIKENGLYCVLNEPGRTRNDFDSEKWPWGVHHTQQLGHLEAAALKWWKNYDPSDSDTAPTNDLVADWLINERGVSKDKARAIASILRADGLPSGRR